MASQNKHRRKKPLYRKINGRARTPHPHWGGDYRHQRNAKGEENPWDKRGAMHGKRKRGRDYTPLYRFLLSKVGEDWDGVYSEAASRLDTPGPIFRMVALLEEERSGAVPVGESGMFSGLYVDEDNRLQIVDPTLGPESFRQTCQCCTITFNGVPVPEGENLWGYPLQRGQIRPW